MREGTEKSDRQGTGSSLLPALTSSGPAIIKRSFPAPTSPQRAIQRSLLPVPPGNLRPRNGASAGGSQKMLL